jgi:tetratricopeptide (TPR) repeat protein
VKQNPDDFRAYQRLDYALASKGAFERVVALWTEYLARHANDGPAYLERGGAYVHLRRLPEAHADATKACTLGVSEGCARAKQLGGNPAPR